MGAMHGFIGGERVISQDMATCRENTALHYTHDADCAVAIQQSWGEHFPAYHAPLLSCDLCSTHRMDSPARLGGEPIKDLFFAVS
jgi:hypothetical protein